MLHYNNNNNNNIAFFPKQVGVGFTANASLLGPIQLTLARMQ